MTDRAAHLVDHVFPEVPIRQWVLTPPPRLRYLLAWDHTLCRAVVAVYLRAVLGWLRRQTKRRGVMDGHEGFDAPDPPALSRWHARQHGFDLHAGIVVPAGSRDRLERLCRCALRPPVGQDRLQLMPDGTAVLELRRRWTDGTTHLVFDPVELLERLAALTPRPRINLVLYHGVLAPRAAWRRPWCQAAGVRFRSLPLRSISRQQFVRAPVM